MVIKEDFEKIKATLIAISPFMSSLLRRARIIITDQIPTACVTPAHTVMVNPQFMDGLGYADKTWVFGHETMHLAFNHVARGGVKYPKLHNYAADAVVNRLLDGIIKCTPNLKNGLIFMKTIHRLLATYGVKVNFIDLQVMSVGEIYKLLLRIPKQGQGQGNDCGQCGSSKIRIKKLSPKTNQATFKCDDCGEEWEGQVTPDPNGTMIPIDEIEGYTPDITKMGDQGDELQKGDKDIYKDKTETAEQWKKAVVKAYTQQKIAGNIPAGLKRMVDDILQSKVNWRSMLRQAFHNGFGKTIITTWRRPSRKHASFPGIHRFTHPTVHCLVDTSGSISNHELEQFIGEIYSLAKNSPVVVRTFDTVSYEEIKAQNQRQVISKIAQKLKGGGGTEIKPCLEKTFEMMRHRDIVVVFTDGEIFDIDKPETQRFFGEVASKSSVAIIGSTYKTVEVSQWHFVKVQVDP